MRIKKNRFLLIVIAILNIGLLSGCFSIIQDIQVLEDGSGTMRFALGIKTDDYEAFQEAIPEGFEIENLFIGISNDENLTSMQINRFTKDGFNWESVELAVADFSALFGQRRRIGPLDITFLEQEGEFRFIQNFDMQNSSFAIPGVNLMDLSRAVFTVNFATPQITSTNGLQKGAGVSTWSIPLDEVLQDGSTAYLSANYVLEPYQGFYIPWEVFFPYLMIGFLVAGGLSIVIVIFVNTVIRREKEPTIKFK